MASEPYELGYPVNFYSGGDTTREAFGKHIQEFSKVYGILNSLQSTKADSTAVTQAINDAKTELNGNINTAKSDLTTALNTAKSTLQTNIDGVQTNLTTHINSSTPHPNLTFDGIKGLLATSRLSGTISDSQISGVSSNKITGTFSTDKISGLQSFVENNIPDEFRIITKKSSDQSCVQFGNEFRIITGTTTKDFFKTESKKIISFPYGGFSNTCICVLAQVIEYYDTHSAADYMPFLNGWTKSDFTVTLLRDNFEEGTTGSNELALSYIAFGY